MGFDRPPPPRFTAPFVVGGVGKPVLRATRVGPFQKGGRAVRLEVEVENLGTGAFDAGQLVVTLQEVTTVTGRRRGTTFRGRQHAMTGPIAAGTTWTKEIEWEWKDHAAGHYFFTVGLHYAGLYDFNRLFDGESKTFRGVGH
jgi:hypothetical protein